MVSKLGWVGLVALLFAALAYWRPAHADHAACGVYVPNDVEAGADTLTVVGDTGVLVTVSDYDTEAQLGSAVLSGEPCVASAEIPLSQPTYGEQLLYVVGDDGSDWIEWVSPNPQPQINVMPHCDGTGNVETTVLGQHFGLAPVLVSWETEPLDYVTPEAGFFALPITRTSVTEGIYEITASDGSYTATALYQTPCTISGVVNGIVYADTTGAWQPVDDATVTLSIDGTAYNLSDTTIADGSYQIPIEYEQFFDLYACAEIDGTIYEALEQDIPPFTTTVDLYVEESGASQCEPIFPNEPSNLTIGTPQVSAIDDVTWEVTVAISNTTDVTITQPFYVDVWTPGASAFGYTEVGGMAASSSQTLTIIMESNYPLGVLQTVVAVVDAIDEIDELSESDNVAETSYLGAAIVESVAIYLLAFDNPSYSAGNLSPQLPETLKGIVAATSEATDKLAVVLADLDQDGDTHIMTVYDGEITYVNGLPGTDGVIDNELNEYAMSDGATLGGFLLWANRMFPSEQTNLFVYAHGAPLAPETDVSTLIGDDDGRSSSRAPVPLPSWIFIHPDMTDMHPVGLLTPHDLGVALEVATSEGTTYDVVDLVHCFSLTIEEVYEIAPYTDMVTGSPNYAYFDAQLPGAALAALDGAMNAETVADTILATYDSLLPADGYPRIMAAVDAMSIEVVKPLWDTVSAEILIAFDINPSDTRNKLATAYNLSAKYDTNYCQPDWTLSAPDALTDMHDFALALRTAFGVTSDVGIAASFTANALAESITSRYVTNGVPNFTTIDNAPAWQFDGLGLALYSDLAGVTRGDSQELSWHAEFYTKTVSAENPYPYDFIRGEVTWADVFSRFWQGQTTSTAGCVRTFPPVRDAGEIAISELVNPKPNVAAVDTPLLPSIGLQSSGVLGHVIVQFSVEQNGATVYSDTIGTGRIFTGTHWLKAEQPWTPTQTGAYTLTVTVDPQNYVDEAVEADNVLVFVDAVSAEAGSNIQPDTAVPNGQQWVTDLSAPIVISDSSRSVSNLEVTAYQFSQPASGVGTSFERSTTVHNTVNGAFDLPLDSSVTAGAVQLHVWQTDGETRTQLPAPLRINYIPANTPIADGALLCYPFFADVGDQIQMRLNVPEHANANLFVWFPNNVAAPNLAGTRAGDDQLRIDSAPVDGEYLLCVRGETAGGTTFTLSVVENGEALFAHPTVRENSAEASIPNSRPLFEQPLPQSTTAPTAIALTSTDSRTPSTIVLLALLAASYLIAFAKRRF